jgi:hypothetical protein
MKLRIINYLIGSLLLCSITHAAFAEYSCEEGSQESGALISRYLSAHYQASDQNIARCQFIGTGQINNLPIYKYQYDYNEETKYVYCFTTGQCLPAAS